MRSCRQIGDPRKVGCCSDLIDSPERLNAGGTHNLNRQAGDMFTNLGHMPEERRDTGITCSRCLWWLLSTRTSTTEPSER